MSESPSLHKITETMERERKNTQTPSQLYPTHHRRRILRDERTRIKCTNKQVRRLCCHPGLAKYLPTTIVYLLPKSNLINIHTIYNDIMVTSSGLWGIYVLISYPLTWPNMPIFANLNEVVFYVGRKKTN